MIRHFTITWKEDEGEKIDADMIEERLAFELLMHGVTVKEVFVEGG